MGGKIIFIFNSSYQYINIRRKGNNATICVNFCCTIIQSIYNGMRIKKFNKLIFIWLWFITEIILNFDAIFAPFLLCSILSGRNLFKEIRKTYGAKY